VRRVLILFIVAAILTSAYLLWSQQDLVGIILLGLAFAVLALYLIYHLILWLPMVGQAEVAVITRHGRFERIQNPGRFILLPFENLHTRIPTNVQIFLTPRQKILLNDGIEAELAMILQYRLQYNPDAPRIAAFAVDDWKSAIEDRVTGPTLYQTVAVHDVTDLIIAQKAINAELKANIQSQIHNWGFHVIDARLTDVHVPAPVSEAMGKGYHLKLIADKLRDIAGDRLKLVVACIKQGVKPEDIMTPNDLFILSYIEALQKMAEDKATKMLIPYEILEAITAFGRQ
jgi:regulator of protease activity HflC (stomatin/prohibitin superfamily)